MGSVVLISSFLQAKGGDNELVNYRLCFYLAYNMGHIGLYKILAVQRKQVAESSKVLFFGYPWQQPQYGGHLWTKRVSDCIKKTGYFKIIDVSRGRSMKMKRDHPSFLSNLVPCFLSDLRDDVSGFVSFPDIAILDASGRQHIMLWMSLRVFRPRTKIVTVFHHYEQSIPSFMNNAKHSLLHRRVTTLYYHIIDKLTGLMIKDSNLILTISKTSAREIADIFQLGGSFNSRIKIVGAGMDPFAIKDNTKKDVDFLCVGRSEKLKGIHEIWNIIKQFHPQARFVIIGRASAKEIDGFRKVGIEHRGFVSEDEKVEWYSKAKVFLFPSTIEGYSIAISEALYAHIPIVAWKIPVFEERFSNNPVGGIVLVERGDCLAFAQKAANMLSIYEEQEGATSLSTLAGNGNATTILKLEKLFSQMPKIDYWNSVSERVSDLLKLIDRR